LNLIDGDTDTAWEHYTTSNPESHWIVLDLGQIMTVSAIRLWHRQYYTTRNVTDIYVSDSQSDWGTSLGSLSISATNLATGWKEADIQDKRGRYIKLVSETATSVSWREFQVQPSTSQIYHPADTDQSCSINDTEAVRYVSHWYMDSTNYPMYMVMEAIGFYTHGTNSCT
jgi:hypothetical protein